MKKRILSVFLVLTMCLTLMPMTAFAADDFTITNGTPESAKETNHGYITVDETAADGETVTVEVYPADGYQLKTLTATPAALTISTIADVLATVEGFPKDVIEDSTPTAPSDAWINGTRSAFTYNDTALILKNDKYMYATLATGVTFDDTSKCYAATLTLGTLKFYTTDGVLTSFTYTHNEGKPEDYDGTYAPARTPSPRLKPITPAKQDDETYTFTMSGYAVTVTAVFEEVPVTIADILPSNFPASDEDNSWCKLENDNVYIYKTDSNLVFNDSTEDCYSVPLSTTLTKEENPEVSYVYSIDGTEIQFNMTGDNDDELESIVVNDCTIPTCIGTYNPIEIVTYDVTYNANGATSGTSPTNQTKEAGVDLTLANNTGSLAKAGYTFAGWNTKADGSGTHYDIGATYKTDAALTLYAEWIEAPATKTIADILPDGFPAYSGGIPINAWKNSAGSKLYINNKGLTFGGTSLYNILTASVTKVENGYKFTKDSYTITFVMDSDKLVKVIIEGAENADYNGEYVPVHAHNDITFTAWKDATKLPETAGNYYLDTDVTLDATWNVPAGTTNLCLNGHVIKLDTDKTGSAITVPANATLNLYDCGTTEHYFTKNATTGLWTLAADQTIPTDNVVTGGVITGGNASAAGKKNGGGVNVSGTFTMNGGNIVGNAATDYGGGVYNNGTFNMNGGGIVGNTASNGGGVYVYKDKNFTMIGGNIVSNAVSALAGGVYVDRGGTNVTLGGTAQIIENFRVSGSDKTAYNYYVLGYKNNTGNPIKTFSLGTGDTEPKSGMKVGITMQCKTGGEFTTNANETQVGCFTPDDSTFVVRLSSESGIELAKLYAITTDDITNGTITTDAKENKACADDTVTITVTPSSGYRLKANTLKAVYDDGEEKTCELTPGAGNTYTFTMPAYAVTVTAEFEPVPAPAPSSGGSSTPTVTVPVSGDANSVKISATVSGSTVTVKPIKDADLAKVADGESVEIDLTGLKKDIDTAKIPASTVEKIGEQAGMSVKLTTATVAFDKTATQEISDQAKGNTVELVVDDIKEVSLNAVQKEAVQKLDTALIIDAYLVSGGTKLCTEGKGGFGGGKATVMLPYEIKNNRSATNYNVFYVDDAGKLEKLAAKYDVKLGAFVFDIIHFSNYVVAYDENACLQDATCVYAKFIDADTKAWYHDGVHFCVENGYMQGISTNKFDPSGTLSRDMIVTMLWRMEGEPVVNYAMSFKDVKAGQWYTEAIRWAQATGVVDGYSADTFGPSDDVTREQLAAILYNYAKLKGQGFTGSWMFLLDFVDRADISSWADEAVHWCSMKGIVNGKTKNGSKVFDPQGKATRAEAASMVQRFCEATSTEE